jgi:hypothetical protein
MVNRVLPLFFFASFAIVVAGCAATYQPLGLLGGYSDEQITNDTFDVWYQGNGWTKPDELEKHLLRRCAEITLEKGYERFVILNAKERSNASRSATIKMFRGRQSPFNTKVHEPAEYLAKKKTKQPTKKLAKAPTSAAKKTAEPMAKPAPVDAKVAAKTPAPKAKEATNAPTETSSNKASPKKSK